MQVGKRIRLGAIDAGSNGIRFVVAELTANGTPRRGPDLTRIEAERVPVRLGRGAFTRGELDPGSIEEAVSAFQHFRRRFDFHGVERYRAVTTSAVRNANNRDVLLHRLYHEAGIELEVIEGDEEARLVRKSVVQAFGNEPLPRVILDLGGGSLEVNIRDASWHGVSLPVGTVRLLETFGLTGVIGDAEAGMVRRYAAAILANAAPVRGDDLGSAAACGGNAEALARILGGDSGPGMPSFEVAALERALPDIIGIDVDQRMARFGVRRDRAEVMGVAALVFATAARLLGITRILVPGVGVREAVLLELAEAANEERARAEGALDKALVSAARTFANRVDHDTTHGEQVRKLSRALFQQLRDVHGLPEELGVVLEVAALLHDIGEVVNPRGHHKHSEYMIRQGRILGLEGENREMVAVLARVHRKQGSELRRLIAEADLPKERRVQLRRMAALLRLADGLDSGHRQRVESLLVSRIGDTITLDLQTRDGPSRDDADLLRKADTFEQEIGLSVRCTVGRAITAPFTEPSVSPPLPAAPTSGPAANPPVSLPFPARTDAN